MELIEKLNAVPGRPTLFGPWKWQPKRKRAISRATHTTNKDRLLVYPDLYDAKRPDDCFVWGQRLDLIANELREVAAYLDACEAAVRELLAPKPEYETWKAGDVLERGVERRLVVRDTGGDWVALCATVLACASEGSLSTKRLYDAGWRRMKGAND